MKLPRDLTSASTLEYLGLVPAVAQDIHRRWIDLITDPELACFGELDFYDSVIGWISHHALDRALGRNYLPGESTDMETDLRSMGAADGLIQGIMAPGHDAVRNSRTARDWLLDTMKMRYQYLKSILDPEESSNTDSERPYHMPTMNADGELWAHERTLSGHTTLYKAMPRTTAELLWKCSLYISPNGFSLGGFKGVESESDSDFSRCAGCYEFTPDWQMALSHAEFIESRLKHGSACVLRIDVPDTILEDPALKVYHQRSWNTDAWRQAIFWSRRGEWLKNNFDDPVGSNLVIADCSSVNRQIVTAMDNWGELGREHVFWLDAEKTKPAKQYIFWDEIATRIEAECLEKMWIYSI